MSSLDRMNDVLVGETRKLRFIEASDEELIMTEKQDNPISKDAKLSE